MRFRSLVIRSFSRICLLFPICVSFSIVDPLPAQGQGEETAATEAESGVAGHSYHGEAFNEGPRQQAYLMDGLGRSNFEISSDVENAQAFFNQGVDQLHGFWYFEAERSFRQVAMLDPDCAMACWGLAMANVNNDERAKEFIEQAVEKSENEEREISELEKSFIDALAVYYDEDVGDDRKRAGNFAKELEEIVLAHPDNIEARAFLVYQIWVNQRRGLKIASHVAVDALLDRIFEVDPDHPAHHYRIHLWDSRKADVALASAASCGASLPDIAHMWHMPGHIYSKLKRYEDAVWQQEASARVDHRHMMHDQILPDQIHNFAHNNEWCVRNLNNVGRVRDAIDLATNMISMPRHPKYNHIGNRGSAWYGRQRLFATLSRYELWQELIDTCHTAVLEPTDDELEQISRLRFLGRASYRMGDNENGDKTYDELQQLLTETRSAKKEAGTVAIDKTGEATADMQFEADNLARFIPEFARQEFLDSLRREIRRDHRKRKVVAVRDAGKKLSDKINVLDRAIGELEGYRLINESEYVDAVAKLKKAAVDPIYRASILLKAGETEKAIEQARKHAENLENEVQPLAMLTWLLWQAEMKDEAAETFAQLRDLSSSVDMNSPVFQRLDEVAKYAGVQGSWIVEPELAEDFGPRPEMESLGPFRWQPVSASEWELVDSGKTRVSLKQFQGQPVIVIFYLGHSCLHCAEQLQKFAPMMEEFKEAGIEMVAISTDDLKGLKQSIDSYGETPLPIQLLADPGFNVFKKYRVFDEFENQPLHGTFLIDGKGRIRWRDVSYEPFMDPEFLLKESTRLLSQ